MEGWWWLGGTVGGVWSPQEPKYGVTDVIHLGPACASHPTYLSCYPSASPRPPPVHGA